MCLCLCQQQQQCRLSSPLNPPADTHLVVAIKARNHQHLLEQLRGLRQRIPVARLQPAREPRGASVQEEGGARSADGGTKPCCPCQALDHKHPQQARQQHNLLRLLTVPEPGSRGRPLGWSESGWESPPAWVNSG